MPRFDDEEDELLMALQSMEPCGNCGADGAKIPCMSGCGEVFYCSRECNMHHASAHRLRCRNLRCSKFNDSDSESGSDSSEEFSDDSDNSEETDEEEEEEEVKPKKKSNKKNTKSKGKRTDMGEETSGRIMMDSEVERRIEEKIMRRLKKQEENRIAQAIEQRMREEKANWRDDEMNRIILEMRERFQHEISNSTLTSLMKKNEEGGTRVGNPQDKSDLETIKTTNTQEEDDDTAPGRDKTTSVSNDSSPVWNNTCRSFQALRIVAWKHSYLPRMTFTKDVMTGIYNVIQEIDGDESFSHISPEDRLIFVNGQAIDETIETQEDLASVFQSFSSPYILKFEAKEADNGKVHDYTVTWSNGPLGVTLKDDCSLQKIPIVNRLTKKGGSVAVKQNIAIGDVLVAINNIDTIQLGCSLSMSILKKVQLPAKLRFRGVGGPSAMSRRAGEEVETGIEMVTPVQATTEASNLSMSRSSNNSMSRPLTYEVIWGEGPLGLTIIPGMDAHDLPVIKKVTGTGTSPGIEKAQVGDLLECMNHQSTAGLPFEDVVGYLKSTPKPVRLKFRTMEPSRGSSREKSPERSQPILTPSLSLPPPPPPVSIPPPSPTRLSRNTSHEDYTIVWGDGPLGLTIDARSDVNGGAYIKRIASAGAAAKLSQDCVGDYLSFINDQDVSRIPFQDIVTHLKNAPRPITLYFRRRPASAPMERATSPLVTGTYGGQRGRLSDTPTRGRKPSAHEENGIYYYNVVWQEGTPLGLSLRSADTTCEYPYITRVTGAGSAAHLPHSVIGDCLISVDSRSVHMGDKSFDEVMTMLKSMPKPLTLKFQSKKDDAPRGGSTSHMHVPNLQKASGWRTNRDGSGANSQESSSSAPAGLPTTNTLLNRSFANTNNGSDRALDNSGGNEEKFSSIQAPFLVQNKLSTGRRQKMLKGLKK